MLKNANHHRCEWTLLLLGLSLDTDTKPNKNNTYPDFSSFKSFSFCVYVISSAHCISIAFKLKSNAETAFQPARPVKNKSKHRLYMKWFISNEPNVSDWIGSYSQTLEMWRLTKINMWKEWEIITTTEHTTELNQRKDDGTLQWCEARQMNDDEFDTCNLDHCLDATTPQTFSMCVCVSEVTFRLACSNKRTMQHTHLMFLGHYHGMSRHQKNQFYVLY